MIPYPYVREFVSLNHWDEKLLELQTQNVPGFSKEENANQRIITLIKKLTIFEQIGAFFQLLAQQLFSRDPNIRRLLPEAWAALRAGNSIHSYTYIPVEPCHWDSLPNEIPKIFSTYLNPSDLGALSQTNTKLKELEDGWKSIAERIHCPLDPLLSSKQQVQTFINKLKQKVETLPSDSFSPIFRTRTKSNKVDDLCALLELLKARDTYIVWKALSGSIGQDNPLTLTDSPKIEDLLKIPQQFTTWCNTHQVALSQLRSLDLRSNNLTSLPPEIGKLTQLQDLYLHNNQLSSLPSEIGNLTQLQSLYLSNNQLSSLPSEIGNLNQLLDLSLDNNQLTSLPKELNRLQNLFISDIPLKLKIWLWANAFWAKLFNKTQ